MFTLFIMSSVLFVRGSRQAAFFFVSLCTRRALPRPPTGNVRLCPRRCWQSERPRGECELSLSVTSFKGHGTEAASCWHGRAKTMLILHVRSSALREYSNDQLAVQSAASRIGVAFCYSAFVTRSPSSAFVSRSFVTQSDAGLASAFVTRSPSSALTPTWLVTMRRNVSSLGW